MFQAILSSNATSAAGCDLPVIGGGPAGSNVAALLARQR
jgi:hypothetical protein